MDKDMLKGLIAGVVLGVVFYIVILILPKPKPIELKPNQVWVYSRYDENPYEVTQRDTMTVLDVKSGYVLYEMRGDTLSNGESSFIFRAKRIK